MQIANENEITGTNMLALRTSLDMTLDEFWGVVCVSKARASNYERGVAGIPNPVKRLLYLHHIIGLPTDADRDTLIIVGAALKGIGHAMGCLDFAAYNISEANEHIKQAINWTGVAKT